MPDDSPPANGQADDQHAPDTAGFLPWVRYGWARAGEVAPLAVVPVLASLLQVDAILEVASLDGFHTGVQFGFPPAIVDLWTVTKTNFGSGVTLNTGPQAALLVVTLAVEGALAAGYLGSIDAHLEGESRTVVADVAAYGPAIVAFNLVVVGVPSLLAKVLAQASVALAVPVVLAVVVVGFALYGVPYLVVRDYGLAGAVEACLDHLTGGAYLRYAVGFLGVTAGLSIVVTTVVVNLGVIGVALGLLIAPLVGLPVSVGTVGFVRALDEGAFDDGDDGSAPPENDGDEPPAADGPSFERGSWKDAGR